MIASVNVLKKFKCSSLPRLSAHFGTAKEFHGLRYTNLIGKEKMYMKIWLTFACLNIKKLAKMLKLRNLEGSIFYLLLDFYQK